jgi:peptidyl-prolyl cis-trans isomerase C
MNTRRCGWPLAALLVIVLSSVAASCGLGRSPEPQGEITDPVVAASVNGRPIYIEDVRTYAVQRGLLREGEDLDANSDAFYVALEEMIEVRLFANEAENRGIDRDADIRRRLQIARERVLATAIYEELARRASDARAVEKAYRDNAGKLGQGQEFRLRHIQFETRDAALAAKRRLDNGERFEALAFELSTDRDTAAEGGDLGFRSADNLPEPILQIAENTPSGQIGGPVRSDVGWHLLRVDDRRQRGVPSLETLRPQIVNWLLFQETQQLRERLEADARIERLRTREDGDAGVEAPGGEVTPPEAAPPAAEPSAPPPAAVAVAEPQRPAEAAPTGQRTPPPFPFPMGPGGVFGGPEPATPTPAPAPAPAQAEAQPAPRT